MKRIFLTLCSFCLILGLAGCTTLTNKIQGKQTCLVNQYSMNPTYKEGDIITLDTKIKTIKHLKRGDIISYKYTIQGQDESLLKRIIGMPGDVILIKDGKVSVNGSLLEEKYILGNETLTDGDFCDFIVPNGKVYVLSDNREKATIDSRTTGPVEESAIQGKAE